jgi:hypothetical protein
MDKTSLYLGKTRFQEIYVYGNLKGNAVGIKYAYLKNIINLFNNGVDNNGLVYSRFNGVLSNTYIFTYERLTTIGIISPYKTNVHI